MNLESYKNEMLVEDIAAVVDYLDMDDREMEDFRTQLIEGNSGAFELLDAADRPWLDALVRDADAALALTHDQLDDIALRTKGHVFCALVRFQKHMLGWNVGTEENQIEARVLDICADIQDLWSKQWLIPAIISHTHRGLKIDRKTVAAVVQAMFDVRQPKEERK